MSSRPPKEEHVVLHDNSFKCLHCGDRYNPFAGAADGKGVEITMLTDMMRSYETRHKRCPKPSEPRRLAELYERHNRKRDEIRKRYDRDQSSRRG